LLTRKQQFYYDKFEDAIKEKRNLLYSSHQRGWGKSYILKELGLTLQALGYEVYFSSDYNAYEFYATKYLSKFDNIRGINNYKTVVIVDECRHSRLINVLNYCESREIPVVGFVDFCS